MAIKQPSSDDYVPTGTITYDKEVIGLVGNNFNPSTGIFTVPRNGVYSFVIDGVIANAYDYVYLYVNGQKYRNFHVQRSDSAFAGLNGITSAELGEGDEVKLHNDYGDRLRVGPTYPFTFMGTLLTET